jgi:hypothetical protein
VASTVGDTVRNKWVIEAEDRTKAAFATAMQNAKGLDRQMATLVRSGGPAGMLGALGIGSVAGIVSHELSQSTAEIDALGKRAGALGMMVEDLDSLEYAANMAGLSNEKLGVSLKTLMRNMADTKRGTGEAKKAFAALGVEVASGSGRLKPAVDVMAEVADGLERIGSPEARGALMQKIFGESGPELINMLRGGASGFRDLMAEAYAMEPRYERLVGMATEYTEAHNRLNRALRSTKDAAVANALPGLTKLVEYMSTQAMNAATGLDEKYRKMLGSMRAMPGEQALAQLQSEERNLQAQLSEAESKVRPNRHWYNFTVGDALGGIDVNEIKKKLGAVRAEIDSVNESMHRAADAEELFRKNGDGLDPDGKKEKSLRGVSAAQAEAVRIWQSSLRPAEQFNYELSRTLQLTMAGELSWSQYLRWFQVFRQQLIDADPATKRHNELMESGRRIMEGMRTPAEMYSDKLQELSVLQQEGAISAETYARAQRQALDDYNKAIEDASRAKDELTNIQEVGVEAVRGFGSIMSSVANDGVRNMDALADAANNAIERIAEAIFQAYVIDNIVGAISGKDGGGSSGTSSGIAGGVISTSPNGMVAPSKAGAYAPTIIFEINAVDGPSVARMLRQQEPTIVGMVEKAYNRAGRRGPNG